MSDEEIQVIINDYYNKLYGNKLIEDEERKLVKLKILKIS